MDYRETPPPPHLEGLVKTIWHLRCEGRADEWVSHQATPDGCLEIIHRPQGRSIWGEEQPPSFVGGIITRPADLRLSGDSAFIGIRLWPWTWNAVGALRCDALIDRWASLAEAAPSLAAIGNAEATLALLAGLDVVDFDLGEHILASRTASDLASRSGRSSRTLQRWFARRIGVRPAQYLRLLRFQDAFVTLQDSTETLAEHAAAHGFADQAHMAREFRAMSGEAASRTRRRAQGPFL